MQTLAPEPKKERDHRCWADLDIFPVVEAPHCFSRQMERVVVIEGVVVRHAGFSAR